MTHDKISSDDYERKSLHSKCQMMNCLEINLVISIRHPYQKSTLSNPVYHWIVEEVRFDSLTLPESKEIALRGPPIFFARSEDQTLDLCVQREGFSNDPNLLF